MIDYFPRWLINCNSRLAIQPGLPPQTPAVSTVYVTRKALTSLEGSLPSQTGLFISHQVISSICECMIVSAHTSKCRLPYIDSCRLACILHSLFLRAPEVGPINRDYTPTGLLLRILWVNKDRSYITLYLNSTGALRPCGTMSRCQRRKESFSHICMSPNMSKNAWNLLFLLCCRNVLLFLSTSIYHQPYINLNTPL